jgi:hypothetical protein
MKVRAAGRICYHFCVIVALFVMVAAMPAAGAFYTVNTSIHQGATVFVGEQGLDLTPAIETYAFDQPSTIGWWAMGANITTTSPNGTIPLTNANNFLVSSTAIKEHYRDWYALNRTTGAANTTLGAFFTVQDPQISLDIRDFSQGAPGDRSVSGSAVAQGGLLGFRVETNMGAAINQPDLRTRGIEGMDVNSWADIRVKPEFGNTFTSLLTESGSPVPIVAQGIDTPVWYWGNTTLTHWATDACDAEDQFVYPAGTYIVTVESGLNGMLDNYLLSGGSFTGKTVSAAKTVTLVANTVRLTTDSATVARSKPFTVKISGNPNTEYYLWLKGTNTMTGTYGNQPPQISLNQTGVRNDTPTDLTYPVGSYQYQGGLGNTIKNNVATDPVYRGTRYYGKITTAGTGNRTVEFITPDGTRAQKYTLRVENLLNGLYKSDEVDVRVEESTVTIITNDTRDFYLGETLALSGTNNASQTTYLFITGPNLQQYGSRINCTDPRIYRVENNFSSTFLAVTVFPNDTWSWNWNTSTVALDAGTYTIWAVSKPRDSNHLADVAYGTATITIKKPFISASINLQEINHGQNATVLGLATGSPPEGVAIWIFGTNYVNRSVVRVRADNSYQFEIDANTTRELADGRYQAVIQHPMQNGLFDVYLNTTDGYVYNLQLGKWSNPSGTRIFKVLGAGVRDVGNSAKLLVQGINDPNVDDTYAKLDFVIGNISAPVDPDVTNGEVTVTIVGTKDSGLGGEILFTGNNTRTAITYLFITGPNLKLCGAQIQSADPRGMAVINGDPNTFQTANVLADDTWSWRWDTTNVALDAGTYTIWVVSKPRDKNHLGDAAYGTISLTLKNPFISADASQSAVAQGDRILINGTASGTPSNGVQIWVLGNNYTIVAQQSVNPDSLFSYEISRATTTKWAPGQVFVVAQHPGSNNQFDIYKNGDSVYNRMLGNPPGTKVFSLLGAGSIQGADAAEALVQAMNDLNVDDMYAKFQFLVENPVITIAPVGDRWVGDTFTIHSTTNLAVDDEVLCQVYSSSFKPTQKSQNGEFSGATGTVKVKRGDGGLNKILFEVNTTRFIPDEYIVQESAALQSATGSTRFNVFGDTPPLPNESTQCYSISAVSIDPSSGTLAPGTLVNISFEKEFRANGDETFPSSNSLQMITDLENPKWTWTLVLNGVENARPQSGGHMLELSGWDLAYPSDIEESIRVSLQGNVPANNQTINKSMLKVQEIDSRNDPVGSIAINFERQFICPDAPLPDDPAVCRGISSVSIDPSGDLIPGTSVVASYTMDIYSTGDETFPSSSSLQMITDLENPKWTWTLVLNGVENTRPQSGGKILELSGWDLSYPTGIVESIHVTLEGKAPLVTSTSKKTIVKIQEVDSRNNVACAVNFERWVVNGAFPYDPGNVFQFPTTLNLLHGWNFISTPKKLSNGNNTAAIFSSIDTAGHSIYLYNASDRVWYPLTLTDKVQPLDGIWIYANKTEKVNLSFDTNPMQTPSTKSLSAGWNAIGFTDTTSISASTTLNSVKARWSTLIGFNPQQQRYESSIVNGATDSVHGDHLNMYPGKGYWLFMTEAGELAAIGA